MIDEARADPDAAEAAREARKDREALARVGAAPAPGFVAASVVLAAAATYLLVTAGRLPLPQYVPLEHRWTTRVPEGSIGMDWFARALATLLASALAAPLARAIAARSAWARRPAATRLLFGLAFGVMGWAALYTVLALSSTPRGHAAGAGDHAHDAAEE